MNDEDLLGIFVAALGTFDHRQSYSPGMFEALKPLFDKLGYDSVAVYIADDYPDQMRRVAGHAGETWFPDQVPMDGSETLFASLSAALAGVPGLLSARLFSHGRELGAIAVTTAKAEDQRTRDAFNVLAKSMSVMAYVECLRTNGLRERQERDVFFAQSLTNRLLLAEVPEIPGLRLGREFIRTLEAGGDFFDLMPCRNGLLGFIGRCSGSGLRTVLQVTNIMRETHRACHASSSLAYALNHINHLLLHQKKRAHQASLCLFEINLKNATLHLAKAGLLDLFLCHPGERVQNISASGGLFLGMVPDPKIQDETFKFKTGHSLVCVTEGFHSLRSDLDAASAQRWFLRTLAATLEEKPKKPLVNALFANLDGLDGTSASNAGESMLALSVESTKR